MADDRADTDTRVWKSRLGSPGPDPLWQEVKEVRVGGPRMEKARTRITRHAVVKDK